MPYSPFAFADESLRAAVQPGLPLLMALNGASEAGYCVQQLQNYFDENCHLQKIVEFSADEFLDYRSRRPLFTFRGDTFSDYRPQRLALYLAHDGLDAPFLLLSGYEPDFKWNFFAETMANLVTELRVSMLVWVQATPMPVPHTRPLTATISGTRTDLVDRSAWRPTLELSAACVQLLEHLFIARGHEVVGFTYLVPHYLATTEFPGVLAAALEGVMAATGLLFAVDQVREAAQNFINQVDRQLAKNPESLEMLAEFEKRIDEHNLAQAEQQLMLDDEQNLPSAEQLASELEHYLQQQHRGSESGEGQGMQ